MKLGRIVYFILVSPAWAYIAFGLSIGRLALRNLVEPGEAVMAQYFEVSPTALGVALLAISGASLTAAGVLIWAVNRHPSRTLVFSAGASLIVASAVAGAMMWIGWVHNAQGEIHGPDYIDWFYWSAVGVTWFVPAHIASFMVTATALALISLAKASRRVHAA